MGIFSNLNKSFESPFTTTIPEDSEYKKLSDLEQGVVYTMVGAFINPKSKYGEHPVASVIDENTGEMFFLSLPKHLTDTINEIIGNDDYIIAVNSGECKFTIRECVSKKYNRAFYTIDFVD